jgi:hypothetical protein
VNKRERHLETVASEKLYRGVGADPDGSRTGRLAGPSRLQKICPGISVGSMVEAR